MQLFAKLGIHPGEGARTLVWSKPNTLKNSLTWDSDPFKLADTKYLIDCDLIDFAIFYTESSKKKTPNPQNQTLKTMSLT